MKKSFLLHVLVAVSVLLLYSACTKDSTDDVSAPVREPRKPLAQAGKDTTIYEPFSTAILDGTASTDPDSNIVSYHWRFVASTVSTSVGTDAPAIGTADLQQTQVSGLKNIGKYIFELTVKDADNLSSKDTMVITVAGAICTGASQEIIFKDLSWDYSWIMEIDIFDFFSYLPPNSYIKNIYIKRDGSSTWEEVVPLNWDSPDYLVVHQWQYGNGLLAIFPGKNSDDDTPDVKVVYCN